jgi:acetoin utilization protein AcuB
MHHPVHTVRPRDSIEHARKLMQEHRVNQLPVLHKNKLVGIVTDRDLRDAYPSIFDIVGSPAKEHDGLAHPENIEVESVMSHNTMSVTSSVDMKEAAAVLQAQRIGALPVIDNDKLVGIIARNDVLSAFITLSES